MQRRQKMAPIGACAPKSVSSFLQEANKHGRASALRPVTRPFSAVAAQENTRKVVNRGALWVTAGGTGAEEQT